jgi:hypothetical protein
MATATQRPTTTDAILVIRSNTSKLRVDRVAQFLSALEEAYNGILLVDTLLNDYALNALSDEHGRVVVRRDREGGRFTRLEHDLLRAKRRSWDYTSLLSSESLRAAGDLFAERLRLRVHSIQVASPGVWEFLGTLNPLEVIRKWKQDSHERKKDDEYRSEAERVRLALDNAEKRGKIEAQEFDNEAKRKQVAAQIEAQMIENERKRLEVFEARVKLAKELGATNDDLNRLFQGLVRRPLKQLEQFDDIMDSVEVKPADEGSKLRV